MMVEEFIFQIIVAALITAMWADVVRLHKKLREIDAYIKYMYYMIYYQHVHQDNEKEEGREEVEGEDADRVKESCVLELITRRGCVDMNDVVELCGVSKTFITNKLYRKKKVVKIDKEGRVCPR
jgi:hypothetical protein